MKTRLLTAVVGFATLSASAHPIDFDRIQNWTGHGPNRAALVIQYNGDRYGSAAYVWGYRWENGEKPTGETMMKAICANSARLSMLTQQTGSMGSTLCGVGYSLNQEILKKVYFNFEKAKTFEFINFDYYKVNDFMGQTQAPDDNAPAIAKAAIDGAIAGSHYIQHPFDYAAYGYPAYDYDCWDIDAATEAAGGTTAYDPKWLAAWYEGYWSYWCASKPQADWMYSGSGFTGRQLSDGAADGWSFTQFETAQVGGMGEGIAPCQDGEIIYMPARLLSSELNTDRCVRSIGDGSTSIPLIVRFGNTGKADNLVLRLRFDGTLPSATDVLRLLSEDPAFGANGNTLSLDADGDGKFASTAFDTERSGNWTLTEYEDCLLLSCDESAVPEYLMYLPAEGEPAAILPDKMTFALSDDFNYIPVFVQRAASYDVINYSWYRRADANDTHSNSSSDIVSSISTSASTLGRLTYAGTKAGEVYIHVRVRTGKGSSYSYSNICHFTLLPPEIPVEKIEFAEAVVNSPLNSTIENAMTITPANATYTALTLTSSDTKVATVSGNTAKTTKTPGSAVVKAASKWNPAVYAEFEVASALRHPVTDVSIRGVEGNVIRLTPKEIIGLIPEVTPANADIPDFDITISGNGTAKDNFIATMYMVNYWDENNNRIRFNELSGHRVGECTVTLKATDGTGFSKTFTVKVEEPDRTPLANGYTDGTLMLNEEWFGHTNGGLNYITSEGDVMYQVYERENPGMSLGCTSQYATIWNGHLIAVSKQAADAGDPLPGGGRVVVADAATLKRQGSFNDLIYGNETKSSDGRAVAGATPDKVYVGSSNGIYIVDLNTVTITGKISDFDESGTTGADLYSGQIGDMINAGRHVFGIKQNGGAFAIDVTTDRVVKKYDIAAVQGVTQTADGNVWIASVTDGRGRFTCIDPATLEINEEMSVTLPAGMAYPTCSWGAWRNTPFVGSHTTNTIWFSAGGGIAGGSSKDKFYGWQVGTDPAALTPVFDLGEAQLTGSNSRVLQKTYGSLRYDERSGLLMITTVDDSASGHYRYNWIHYIAPATGEIVRTIALKPYYWFMAFPLFPDRYDAVIDLDDIDIDVKDDPRDIDLTSLVSDKDNIDANIRLSLAVAPMPAAGTPCAEVSLNDNILTVSPLSAGRHEFTLTAESNGRAVTKNLAVNVSDVSTGINRVAYNDINIECVGHRLFIRGAEGHAFRIYDTAGVQAAAFTADSDAYIFDFGSHSGIYVICSDSNYSTKVIIK